MYSLNKIICFMAAMTLLSAVIVEFDDKAISRALNEKGNTIFLFTSTNDQSRVARGVFSEFDATNPENLFLTVSDSEDGHGLYQRLAEYLGVDLGNIPSLLYFNSNSVKFVLEEQITLASIQNFVAKVQAEQWQPYFKSHPIPQSNDAPVKIIVGKMFNDYVLNSDKEFLIEFYAPWCGHCKHLAPKYDEAARILSSNPNIVLAKVDSTGNEIPSVSIQGYPTLKFWGKDKSIPPIQYDGARQVDGIIDWLKQHTQYPWIEGASQEL